MNPPVPRTVTRSEPIEGPRYEQRGWSLSHFEGEHCYVLLGEPGLGKTTAFNAEARRVHASDPITARRFIRRSLESIRTEMREPLFIDGLDELRAGGADPREPLDIIRDRLEKLGDPKFRLSCRPGSWLVPGDQRELSTFSGSIPILWLNDLDHDGVKRIVAQKGLDPERLINDAMEHRLDTFLWNPQLLGLLCKAVSKDKWPDSPGKALEWACKQLAHERNSEHQDARRGTPRPSRQAVLSAVGELSALLLISGKEGWNEADSSESDILSLDELESENRDALLAALESGLFRGGSNCRAPVHRLVAEFLAARYLDCRIRAGDGVSAQRVLSLLVGYDGIPMPDLRGLSAWLAAVNPFVRKVLIRADPVAVAFEGDASSFSSEEGTELFKNIENRIELRHHWPSAAAVSALVGSVDRSIVWELTAASERSGTRQVFVDYLLVGISHAYRRKRVTSTLQLDVDVKALRAIIRDATWWDEVRCRALAALDQALTDSPIRARTLCGLLADIENERLQDEKNRLLGMLLDRLYPSEILPANIWNYLEARPFRYRHDEYQKFWKSLVDRSSEAQIRELIESLCVRASEVIPKLVDHWLSGVVLALLGRGLALLGEDVGSRRIHRWFDLVDYDFASSHLAPVGTIYTECEDLKSDSDKVIRDWLNGHPQIQCELIELDLFARQAEIGPMILYAVVGRKYLGKEAPAGFRRWCLDRAVALTESQPKIAEELAGWAIQTNENWSEPLSDDEVACAVQGKPALQAWNRKRLAANVKRDLEEAKREERTAEFQRQYRERQQAELAKMRQYASELREGHGPPALLHKLALTYLDGLVQEGSPNGAVAQLALYLNDDESLVEASLKGFRSLLDRDDLPDLTHIIELYERSRQSLFAIPFLAGIVEEERTIGSPLERLGRKGRRRALGFYFVSNLPQKRYPSGFFSSSWRESLPAWFLRALDSYPRAAADAMVAVHAARVLCKRPPDHHLYNLCREPAYKRVAVLAVPRMFSDFPSRCTGPQVESLRLVLEAALAPDTMPKEILRELVIKRLRRKGMDVAQRAQWLCTGLVVAKDQCLPAWEEYLMTGSFVRASHVVDFFVSLRKSHSTLRWFGDWDADELGRLIRALGRRISRVRLDDGPKIFEPEEKAQLHFELLFDNWIAVLADCTDDKAANALDSLAADAELDAWNTKIRQAQDAQARIRRVVRHKNISLAQIQHTLRGGEPSSAADLAALVQNNLEELARRIRDGSTNDWRQYWHWDPISRKPTEPKHENDCRDVLLSDLQQMLVAFKVDAQPEGQYAEDKRADIRVAYGADYAIPIEIKKNSHRDIWRAVKEQLVRKYTRAPESGGYGIYLVFWFGAAANCMRVPPRHGHKPQNPIDLKERLEQQIPQELRTKIRVLVVDVSPTTK